MQKQRNQRQLSRIVDRIISIIFVITMIYALIQIGQTVALIADVQSKLSPRGSSVTTNTFLPEDYSECGYQAAVQRYDIEHGYVFPDDYTEN